MSRNYSQSGVYHILFRGVNQQNIFEEKADYDEITLWRKIKRTIDRKWWDYVEIPLIWIMDKIVHKIR